MNALRFGFFARVVPLSFISAALSVAPVSASSLGLLDVVVNLFSSPREIQRVVRHYNSQNAPILEGVSAIDPNKAQGGGFILVDRGALVPEPGPLAKNKSAVTQSSGRISVYTVRQGDTLSQIADMYDVSVNTILWANTIKNGVIHKGDTLVILPISGIKHEVQKGDTLSSIAKKYKGNADEIALYNGLAKGESLAKGSEVIIPGGEIEPVLAAKKLAAGNAVAITQSGSFIRPIAGGVRTQGIHGYNGVDLATHKGAELYAAASGRVLISREEGWNGGYGNYIVIEHSNGIQTLYSHNTRNTVRVGQRVSQGEVIGYVGSTGRSTGPHVHFEVRGAPNPF